MANNLAMTGMLPLQLAGILFIALGPNAVSIGVGAFAVVFSMLVVYAINAGDAPDRANRLLFLTPVQYGLAAYITFFIYRQMHSEVGQMLLGGGGPSGRW